MHLVQSLFDDPRDIGSAIMSFYNIKMRFMNIALPSRPNPARPRIVNNLNAFVLRNDVFVRG